MPGGPMLRHDLEAKAKTLRARLEEEEVQKQELRNQGSALLSLADNILSTVERSLEKDGGGALTARGNLGGDYLNSLPLPPIALEVRPETAER